VEEFSTPSHTQRTELEIKRSRFITTIGSVESKDAAKAFITSIRTEFPDANHHCWATVAGAPNDVHQQDQSDDGEPKGTAGKPMLNVLQHSGLGNTVVVVTRYFGGIKLGAGGLVRAYTRAVSEALKTLDTETVRHRESMLIVLPYSELDIFEHWLKSHHSDISDKQFSDTVQLTLLTAAVEKDQIVSKVIELGGRMVKPKQC